MVRNQRPYIRQRLLVGIPFIIFAGLVIGLAAAYYRGLLSIGAALTAAFSFTIGELAVAIGVRLTLSRMHQDLFRATRSAQASFDYVFDDDGIVVKMGPFEARLTWDAISGIQDVTSIVAFWYDPMQGFFIPGRAFSDDDARISFVAWAWERVRAATPPPTATPVQS
jgi:hypothetical protein